MDLLNRTSPVIEKSFMETLDNACGRLQEKQTEYTLRRLDKLEAVLTQLETELDIIIRSA